MNESNDNQLEDFKQSPERTTKSSKKLLYQQIRDQMEFYFSDSNLSKDRFLKQAIVNSEDGYLDLCVFLKFNKIRSLSTSLHKIAKALKKSEFLELNDDQTKIRRKLAFVEPAQHDIDKRTVYVENLPSHVTHDLLKRVFSRCGTVTYVSLPKFKSTGQIKGFAFVEFENKESAKNAIKLLNDPDMVQDNKVGKFPKFNKKVVSLEEKLKKESQTDSQNEITENMEITNYSEDMSSSDDESSDLKVRNESNSNNKNQKRKLSKTNNSLDNNEEPNNKEQKFDDDHSKEKSSIENQESDGDTKTTTGKKKQNKGKKHTNKKAKNDEIQEEATLLHLRVISKKDWLKLREEYLQKQKENISILKQKLKNLRDNEAKLKTVNLNETKNENLNLTDVQNGTIVKLLPRNIDKNLNELIKMSQSRFKNEILQIYNNDIAYVDLDKNTNKIYIRFKTNDVALNFIQNNEILEQFNRYLLKDQEENEYLKRIEAKRNKNQAKKDKKLRGKSKVLKNAYDILSGENQNILISNEDIGNKTQKNDDKLANSANKHIKFEED